MSRMLSEIHQRDEISKNPSLIAPIPSSAATPYHQKHSSLSTISPVFLLVISVLALVIVSLGILHLLLRFLIKSPTFSQLYNSNPNPDTSSSPHALQGQLRQLFLLHDSGLDQSAIDALPVFCYRDIIMGLKEPFDCAVCLCEFSDMDNLRLLPACSHAFHVYCIDTWLLSNSTCPLCRANLSSPTSNFDSTSFNFHLPRGFNNAETEPISAQREESKPFESKRVFSVRLGKFRSLNERQTGQGQCYGQSQSQGQNQETTRECGLGSRRCYSMGTHQYLEWDQDFLVALSPRDDGKIGNNSSVCEGQSVKLHSAAIDARGGSEKRINGRFSKNESISVSKVWLWSKKSNTLLHHSSSSPVPLRT